MLGHSNCPTYGIPRFVSKFNPMFLGRHQKQALFFSQERKPLKIKPEFKLNQRRTLKEEQFRLREIAEEFELEPQIAIATPEENVFLEAEYIESNACTKLVQDREFVEIAVTQNKSSPSSPSVS